MKRLFLACSAALMAAVAPANIIFNFDQDTWSGLPGGTVTLTGTIENLGTERVYLNGLDIHIYPGLASDTYVDLSPFLSGPYYLDAGQSYSGDLVTFDLALDEPHNHLYNGDALLIGGADEMSGDSLADPSFHLFVGPPGSNTPEPCTMILMGSAGIGAFLRMRRRKFGAAG